MSQTKLSKKNKKKREFPHVFVLLFIIVLIAVALTYIIPAGEFERIEDPETGRMIAKDNSYHLVEQQPVSIVEIPGLFITGLNEASDIILFIFVVGGAFQIITATGIFDLVVRKVAHFLGNRQILIIPIFLTLFSVGGFTIGMTVEGLALIPLAIALARSLGYDAITGLSMVFIGMYSGFISGLMNPFNVGVAQQISEVPIYSGMWLRAILLVVLLITASIYIIRYAIKVKKDPTKSIVFDMEQRAKKEDKVIENLRFQTKHYFVFLTILLGLGLLVWGVINKGWYINDIAALFLAMGIIAGLCAKFTPSHIAEEFIVGVKAFALGALIVGVARAIPVALEEALIIDTVINGLANLVVVLPDAIQVLGIYFVQSIINFFINSGSGQAAATMPIIAPLGDLIGITRQTGVLTFQLGDGFTNLIFPTGTTLMAYLAASGVPYEKWVKFIWPLVLIFIAIGGIFIVVANVIGY
ncbi:C4-dicarboxylate ABC transporter permease [Virgibacillus profundi]|uniref:C4-dicarboxylate ABC transporter permease n=1 Tax=Virgibacillus profundi TaxID=2024555 RepID=A0A2A2IG87_9BACI|nr:AbgT family transporter [Virgibacillus profundi]PAV30779.1 C4-dicarboxylate ABC transporter permease [Virgibacillus profundi]PXY54962.1 putative basic amino acid antiporter YfcC [Virgibacillus profundi]